MRCRKCYTFVTLGEKESPKTACFSEVSDFSLLFKFDCRRGFIGDVVEDAVDAFDLVCDAF